MKTFPKRRSIRLPGYDYSLCGYYFVTVCTYNRECVLGDVENGKIILNDIGKIVEFTWLDLTQYNANIELDQFIVMPNHVHGIIIVGAGSKSARVGHGLSEIVRQFKTFSAKRVNRLHRTSGMCFWQRNYYEHVIRSDAELTNMCRYIVDNPQQWGNDIENTDNDTGGFRTRPYTDIFC